VNTTGAGEDDDDVFEWAMTFRGGVCPACDHVAEPGPCPKCGTEIPPPEGDDDLARARQKAFGPLVDRAQAVVDAFAGISGGSIPVGLDQFATAVNDADIFHRCGQMPLLGHELAEIDLNDKKTLGTTARGHVAAKLDVLEAMHRSCEELAAFSPGGPANEIRDLAIASGEYGAIVTLRLLQMATASTTVEARERQEQVQELLSGFPYGDRLDELFESFDDWSGDELDSRVGRVLGRPGIYTDELGLLAPARIFGAFADEDQPFAALGTRAIEYFEPLLAGGPLSAGAGVVLAFPAITVGIASRPFFAWRCGQLAADLTSRAIAVDKETTASLFQALADRSAVVFAAALGNEPSESGLAGPESC
jgi:hypothetical protein